MDAYFTAALGVLAVILIPGTRWVSQRVTREGRLLLRIQRLGVAYSVMPAGAARDEFASHIEAVTAELNGWLDPENRRRREAVRAFGFGVYVMGVVIAVVFIRDASEQPWGQVFIGVLAGAIIVAFQEGASRLVRRRKIGRAKDAEREREAARHEAIRRGEPIKGAGV